MEKKVENQKSKSQDLKKDLQDLNIENLIAKSVKTRSIWKSEFKLSYSDNEKTARRKIRSEQLRLSKAILHNVLTDQSAEAIKTSAKSLFDFYTKGLENFADYTNVSVNENPEKRKIVDSAYNTMRKVLDK